MRDVKTIGLIAHDARKQDLLDWVRANAARLVRHGLVCTGTTGKLISQMLSEELPQLKARITSRH